MKLNTCNREGETERALRQHRVSAELQSHMNSCGVCQTIAGLTTRLQKLSEASKIDRDLPSPGLVLWKFRKRENLKIVSRALRPIKIFRIVAVISSVVILAGLIFLTRTPNSPGGWADFFSMLVSSPTVLPLIVAGLFAFSVAAATLAREILSDR